MYSWNENVKIDVYKEGILVHTTQFHNIVTDIGRDWIAEGLWKDQMSKITYMAWGSDSTAVAVGQTTLDTETGRKLITSASSGSVTGSCVTICYIAPTEAVGSIEELGWFCGAASPLPNTGSMISRVLYSRVKTAVESITVTRTDTFTV